MNEVISKILEELRSAEESYYSFAETDHCVVRKNGVDVIDVTPYFAWLVPAGRSEDEAKEVALAVRHHILSSVNYSAYNLPSVAELLNAWHNFNVMCKLHEEELAF